MVNPSGTLWVPEFGGIIALTKKSASVKPRAADAGDFERKRLFTKT
jgi:hypothetical protein